MGKKKIRKFFNRIFATLENTSGLFFFSGGLAAGIGGALVAIVRDVP